MVSKTSEGVEISVETFYQPDYSNPGNGEFTFAYKITLANLNDFPVRLLRRHWFITEAGGEAREVEGEGVVGVQPLISPGQTFQYMSGCMLNTEIGRMKGTYTMENGDNGQLMEVNIPPFDMIVPFKNN